MVPHLQYFYGQTPITALNYNRIQVRFEGLPGPFSSSSALHSGTELDVLSVSLPDQFSLGQRLVAQIIFCFIFNFLNSPNPNSPLSIIKLYKF